MKEIANLSANKPSKNSESSWQLLSFILWIPTWEMWI